MKKGLELLGAYDEGYESDKEPKPEKEETTKNGKPKKGKNKGEDNVLRIGSTLV